VQVNATTPLPRAEVRAEKSDLTSRAGTACCLPWPTGWGSREA